MRFRDIAAFGLQNAIFPTPPLVFPMFPSEWVDVLWATITKSEGVGLTVCALQFVAKISNLIRQRYGQTDGRHVIAKPRFALQCIAR